MKAVQAVGFFLAVVWFASGYSLLAMVEPDTPTGAGAAVVLMFMFVVLPTFCCSALLLVPSSIALLIGKLRVRSCFSGPFWIGLLSINILLSVGYISAVSYIALTWFGSDVGT
jgi:hypothetical protein